jgi:catechol 2,3-dioxygenase-like lactoylglutathione lyase family enzyme
VILGVLHFSFTVSDIDRSVAWYCDVLGLELVHRQRQDNAYTCALVGHEGAVLEVAQLRLRGSETWPSTHMLELVQYVHPQGLGPRHLPTHDVGTAHLAFVVDDIEERFGELRAQGVHFVNPPVAITEGANAGGRVCYFHDPDHLTLELLQPAPARLAALRSATG